MPVNRFTPSRGVAQSGSALAWGARGRVFESLRPDQIIIDKAQSEMSGLFRVWVCARKGVGKINVISFLALEAR